jgi:TonB family protein
MNAGDAAPHSFPELPPAQSWGWKKLSLVIALAFAAHLAFVFLLGAKKMPPPRAVANVPVFHLANNAGELARFTDPTLFALPHAEDAARAVRPPPAGLLANPFHFTEAPALLPLNPANLGGTFAAFMQTNRFAVRPPSFKPEPQLAAPATAVESALPQNSVWRLAGNLAARKLRHAVAPPVQAWNDVLPPSRVQLLVDPVGNVLSAVLLDSSGDEAADLTALTLARTLQFVPAARPVFGEMIFNWHTVPAATP